MINEFGEELIEHHVKYKEIHGVDKTIWITKSEHRKLHKKLRDIGKCNVPVKELARISKAACNRTKKGKEAKQRHNQTRKQKETRIKYDMINLQHIDFYETPGPNTRLNEKINYNRGTGSIYYSAWFSGSHNHKLPVIHI